MRFLGVLFVLVSASIIAFQARESLKPILLQYQDRLLAAAGLEATTVYERRLERVRRVCREHSGLLPRWRSERRLEELPHVDVKHGLAMCGNAKVSEIFSAWKLLLAALYYEICFVGIAFLCIAARS